MTKTSISYDNIEEVIRNKTVKTMNKTSGYILVPKEHIGKGVDVIVKKLDE